MSNGATNIIIKGDAAKALAKAMEAVASLLTADLDPKALAAEQQALRRLEAECKRFSASWGPKEKAE